MAFSSSTFTPVCSRAELREREKRAGAGLMERAGLAAANIARELSVRREDDVLVVAGPGNNGGDAFVVARYLKAAGKKVTVVLAAEPSQWSSEARAAFEAWRNNDGITTPVFPKKEPTLIIDGLFGVGLQRRLEGTFADAVNAINRFAAPVLALDIPSGIEADSGRILGCAVRAEHTATFIALKPGLLTLDGLDHCGLVHLCPLDIEPTEFEATRGAALGDDVVQGVIAARMLNSHKGTYGSVGIIGGAPGMQGAALLSARGALALGAGRVYAGFLDSELSYDPGQLELMPRTVEQVLKLPLTCIVIGPGLGRSPEAYYAVKITLDTALPLVIDADALNVIAFDKTLQTTLQRRQAPTVLTPHPAEAARLLGSTVAEIQGNRVAAACEIAAHTGAFTLLKGAGSICATPEGEWFINTTGNPGMASAGMGDVLAGIIAAFIAQGAEPKQGLLAGVYLHGAVADEIVATIGVPFGITASEIIAALRACFTRRQKRLR